MHAALRRRRLLVRIQPGTPLSIPLWPTQKGTRPVNEFMRARLPPGDPLFGARSVIVRIRLCESRGAGAEPAGPTTFGVKVESDA